VVQDTKTSLDFIVNAKKQLGSSFNVVETGVQYPQGESGSIRPWGVVGLLTFL
jgi:hypothetical protein